MNTQLHISTAEQLIPDIQPVKNRPNGLKPTHGFWTSTWNAEEETSARVDWCRSEDFRSVEQYHWYLLIPFPDARIYTIDSLGDLHRCLKEFGYPHSYYPRTSCLDFEKLATCFDGLHLTEQGNEETHLSLPYDLNTWDCESTLWFRWVFSDIKQREPTHLMSTVL